MAATTYAPEKKAEASYRPYAECIEDDCAFGTSPSASTFDVAKEHIRRTGHSVRMITEKVVLWGAK
jgi:hypothetical protein